MVPEEWPSRIIRKNGALQNPAYRLADIFENEGFGVTRRTPRQFWKQSFPSKESFRGGLVWSSLGLR